MSNKLHFAVCIGINEYPEFRTLNYAKGDAEEFCKWLLASNGGALPKTNVKKIVTRKRRTATPLERAKAKPIKKQIYDAIWKFMEKVKDHTDRHPEDWPKTRLYLYMSGHGFSPSTRDVAVLMADAGPSHYGENISCDELRKFLSDSHHFAEVVVFADCCRDRVPSAPIGHPPWTLVKRDFPEVNSVLAVAADYGGKAYEPDAPQPQDPDEHRGYFTTALLEALNGNGSEGRIDIDTVTKYLRKRVTELVSKKGKSQKCHIYADLSEPIVFGRTQANAFPLTILFETNYHGEAVLVEGQPDNEIKRKKISGSGSVWNVSLRQGFYRILTQTPGAATLRNDGYFAVVGGENVIL